MFKIIVLLCILPINYANLALYTEESFERPQPSSPYSSLKRLPPLKETNKIVQIKNGSTAREINKLISTFPNNTIYIFENGIYRLNESIVLRTGNTLKGSSPPNFNSTATSTTAHLKKTASTTVFTGALVLSTFI